jgi:4a-hydroxytetrahydrobiopterin dehydratase
MSANQALSTSELTEALATLPGWSVVTSSSAQELHKRFTFDSFAPAIAFMASAVEPINKLNHHPRWENVWNRLDVYLSTHDLGNNISARDVELARLLDGLYSAPAL